MSKFEKAKEKISLRSLDDGTLVVAQYNPKELQVDKTVPWSKVNQSNQSNERGIHLEFTGAEGRSLTIELLFDGYEDGGRTTNKSNESVSELVTKLERLASVWKPESEKEDERRPHRCVAAWGAALTDFRCVIESLSTKYTMFSSEGAPLRATCTVKLKEADVVSMAKGGGGAGGGPGGSPRSGGGSPSGGGTPR
jgi:hypothetical protein